MDQKGKKKRFTPNSNNSPKKNSEGGKKKKFSKKLCWRCKVHGGAQTAHNTKECRKYNERGKLFVSFGRNKQNGGNHSNKRPREMFDSCSFVHTLGKEIAKNTQHSIYRMRVPMICPNPQRNQTATEKDRISHVITSA